MRAVCPNCGFLLDDEIKVCSKCNYKLAKLDNKANFTNFEIVLDNTLALGIRDNPFKIILSFFKNIVYNVKNIFNDKKQIILLLILVANYFLVNLFKLLGVFKIPTQVLSWLTVSQGKPLGGIISKGIFAYLLSELFIKKSLINNVKAGLDKVKNLKDFKLQQLGNIFIGAALALIFSNLIMHSQAQNIIASFSALLLSLQNVVNKGFVYRLVSSIFKNKKNKLIEETMLGFSLGFLGFSLISFLPGKNNGYFLGVIVLILGIFLIFINTKEVVASD